MTGTKTVRDIPIRAELARNERSSTRRARHRSGAEIQDKLQRLVDRTVVSGRVQSIVVGVQSGDRDIDVAAAAGHAYAHDAAPMTIDTPYFLASITKMYTATVVVKLAEAGVIDLQAPISGYLPADRIADLHVLGGIDYSSRITVAQLVDQTSGLADYFEGCPGREPSLVDALKQGQDRSVSLDDITTIVRGLKPEFAPGTSKKAFYSDTNYALLGAIIETATDSTVADAFDRLIFTPLGLTNTYVSGTSERQPPPASLHFKNDPVDIPLAIGSFAADGGVVSTVAESLRFLRAIFEAELLTEQQLAHMTSHWNRMFFPLRYGYGLMRFQVQRWMSPFKAPPLLIGHSGMTGSFAFHDPTRDLYLAGTLNQMDKPNRPFRFMTHAIGLIDT